MRDCVARRVRVGSLFGTGRCLKCVLCDVTVQLTFAFLTIPRVNVLWQTAELTVEAGTVRRYERTSWTSSKGEDAKTTRSMWHVGRE